MRDLTRYFARKSVRYLVIIFIVLTINFMLPRMMPGDPIDNILGEPPANIDPQLIDELRHQYGLDRPIGDQYTAYLGSLLNFDFGYSLSMNTKVTGLILYRLGCSVALLLPAIVIGSLAALMSGVYAGSHIGGRFDRVMVSLCTFMFTIPSFLISMLAVTVLAYQLGWFPLGQLSSGDAVGPVHAFVDALQHLFLPIAVLSFLGATSKFLMVRNVSGTIHNEYFVFVAHAKGLSESRIRSRYVLRNIMPQFISMIAMNLGFMVSGSMLIEIVFSLNGMGTLVYDSIMAKDYPLIQGCFVFILIFVLSANFLAELFYGVADPRVGDSNVTSQR
jgi:peptide/nickel transport system permease protein